MDLGPAVADHLAGAVVPREVAPVRRWAGALWAESGTAWGHRTESRRAEADRWGERPVGPRWAASDRRAGWIQAPVLGPRGDGVVRGPGTRSGPDPRGQEAATGRRRGHSRRFPSDPLIVYPTGRGPLAFDKSSTVQRQARRRPCRRGRPRWHPSGASGSDPGGAPRGWQARGRPRPDRRRSRAPPLVQARRGSLRLSSAGPSAPIGFWGA